MMIITAFFTTLPYALVEAVTEFLPVSSTAHLLLLGRVYQVFSGERLALLTVVIQVAAALALVVYFWQGVWDNRDIWGKLLLAVIPTGVLGVVLHDLATQYLQDATPLTGWMLIGFGIVFSWLGWRWDRQAAKTPTQTSDLNSQTNADVHADDVNLQEAWIPSVREAPWYRLVGVGLAQTLALIPGVSRSGATITGARACGFAKIAATGLAFVVAVPVLLGAGALDLVKTIIKQPEVFYQTASCPEFTVCEPEVTSTLDAGYIWALVLVTLTTFVLSYFLMRPLLRALARWPFWYFGVYRLVIGVIWLLLFLRT